VTGSDWPEVERLFGLLVDRSAADRLAFWETAAVHPDLRRKVEQLLDLDASDRRLEVHGAPPTASDLEPGDRLDQYTVLELIGEGGMGTIYLARQETPVRRQVALKIVKLGMDTQRVITRFEIERQTLAMMDHPHIARLYDAGTGPGGRPYFVMEHVTGAPLTMYADQKRLGLDERLRLFLQACDAVQSAHQRGVIHRDLKPANLLVTEVDGEPFLKVIDFGIAKVTAPEGPARPDFTTHGEIVGTLEYMSPEQMTLVPKEVETISDIYSLGVILYELLTGMLPFDFAALHSTGLVEIQRTLFEVEPPRPSARLAAAGAAADHAAAARGRTAAELRLALRNELDWVVIKALSKTRSERYPSASELAADIRRHLDGQEVLARDSTVTYRLRKTLRRHRVAAVWVLLVVLSLLAGVVGTTRFALKARVARRVAEYSSYTATLQAAASALEDGGLAEAEHLLAESPPHLRGWEWRHLAVRLEDDALSMQVPDEGRFLFADGQFGVAEAAGELRALIGYPHTLGCWDLSTGQLLRERALPGANLAILTPDGETLVFEQSGVLVGERAVDGGDRRVLMPVPNPIPLRFSIAPVAGMPDRVLVADGSEKFLLDLRSGDREPVDSRLLAMRGGRQVVAVGEGMAQTTQGGRQALPLSGARALISIVRIDPAGTRVFGGTWDGELLSWDEAAPVPVWYQEKAHRGAILELAVDGDGERVATAGADHVVRVWNARSGMLEQEFQGHRRQVMDVAFLAAGKQLVSMSDSELRVWRLSRREVERHGVIVLRGHTRHVYPVAFTPGGESLLSGGWDGRFLVWDPAVGRLTSSIVFEQERTGESPPVTAVAPAPDGTRVFVGVNGSPSAQVFAIDLRTGAGVPLDAGRDLGIVSLAHDPKRQRVAILWSGYEGVTLLDLHDTESGQLLQTLRPRQGAKASAAKREFTRAAAYSPDGRYLAVVLGDDRLLLVDAATLEISRTIELQSDRLSALAFSPDSQYLAAGRADLELVVYRVKDGTLVAAMPGHTAEIFSVAWSPDGSRLVSGADDRTLRIWDTVEWHQLVTLRGHDSYVYSVAFSPDGEQVASGSGDGTIRLWNTRSVAESSRDRPNGDPSSAEAGLAWKRRIPLATAPTGSAARDLPASASGR